MRNWKGFSACLALFALFCLTLAGCGRRAGTPVADDVPGRQPLHAVDCEAPVTPLSLTPPQTDGALNTVLEGDVLSGVFTTVSSCRTRDFCTSGSLTVRVQAALNDDAPPADGKLALWVLTADGARYLQTVSFACDGRAQGWTFDGLDTGAQYRLVFSYTESAARRMSGAFSVGGVTQEIIEALPEEEAVAVDAPPDASGTDVSGTGVPETDGSDAKEPEADGAGTERP